jgi:GxxExxY protein
VVELLFSDITEKIIGAAFEVHNALGKGLSEKAYENALALKLQSLGLRVCQQKELPVMFEGQEVGKQVVDLLVEECVIVEIKAVQNISRSNEAQLLGYLRNTHFQVGLLINFGDRVEFKRFVHSY